MTLVFGKLVNEFNQSNLVQPNQLKAVVNKYAYGRLVHLPERSPDLSQSLLRLLVSRAVPSKPLTDYGVDFRCLFRILLNSSSIYMLFY